MMCKKLYHLFIYIFFLTDILTAAGTVSGKFLKINVSPRATALGNAYAAVEAKSSLDIFNPASLKRINDRLLSFSNLIFVDGYNYSFLSYLHPKSKYNLGFFAGYLSYGEIPKTIADYRGRFISDAGTFNAGDILFGISYDSTIKEVKEYRIDVGYNLKYAREFIDDKFASSILGDIGLMGYFSDKYNIGLLLNNFGTKFKFFETSFSPPTDLIIGISSILIKKNKLLTSISIEKLIEPPVNANLGIEFNPVERISIQFGLSKFKYFSTGIGFQIRKHAINYSISGFNNISLYHHISIDISLEDLEEYYNNYFQ